MSSETVSPSGPRQRLRRVLLWATGVALIGLATLQLLPHGRSNPPVVGDLGAPAEIDAILRQSCYDCHSNETRWPWYARVAPVSWWLVSHVDEGRRELNFSEWSSLEPRARRARLKDIEQQVALGEMPLGSYVILHPGARLSDAERDALRRWTRTAGR